VCILFGIAVDPIRMADTTDQTGDTDGTRSEGESADVWANAVTESALRIAVGIVGLVLLLFALGRAFGVDLLGAVGSFFATPTGQWIGVAIVALVLIAFAAGGWHRR
jgi:hypothetical protein